MRSRRRPGRSGPPPPRPLHDRPTLLAKGQGDRYPTAPALRDDLDRLLDGRAIGARRVGPVERPGRWSRQPERLRDAGSGLRLIGSILVANASFLEVGTLAGFLRPPRPVEALGEGAEAFAWFDGPIALAGLPTLRRERIGPWLRLIGSLGFCVGIARSVSVRPSFTFGGIFDGESPRSISEGLLVPMACAGVALSAPALLASRAEARRLAPRPALQAVAGGASPG